MALCNTSGMCVPPGTSIFAVAREIGTAVGVALLGPAGGAAADNPEGCAAAVPVDGCVGVDAAAGLCPGEFCAGGCVAGAGGSGPSCCANTEPASPRNAKTTEPANCKRSERLLMYCPQYICPDDALQPLWDVPEHTPCKAPFSSPRTSHRPRMHVRLRHA
jgi:hypothetical protein